MNGVTILIISFVLLVLAPTVYMGITAYQQQQELGYTDDPDYSLGVIVAVSLVAGGTFIVAFIIWAIIMIVISKLSERHSMLDGRGARGARASEKKVGRRSVSVALGIACIVLVVVGLVGAVAYVMSMINDKDNTISSLNLKVSQSNTNNTNLQNQNNQLHALLNAKETLLTQTETWLDGNITYYNSQISSLNSQIADLQNQLNVSNAGTLLLLKISTTSDWTGFACLNGTINAMPFNSSGGYDFISNGYNKYPILNVNTPSQSENIVFCLVLVNPNYVYSLGKGSIGWATYEFYHLVFQSDSMQIGSEILSLQAKSVMVEGNGALDGTLFKFP